MATVIAIANQKGGTGKTTTTVTLGHRLALDKYRVLIIDTDVQGHVAIALGLEKQPGIYQAVQWFQGVGNLLVVSARPGLDVLPGDKSFQSLSRDSGRLNESAVCREDPLFVAFQSLSRDSGRLNRRGRSGRAGALNVSIPQSGFGAFEPRPTQWVLYTTFPNAPVCTPSISTSPARSVFVPCTLCSTVSSKASTSPSFSLVSPSFPPIPHICRPGVHISPYMPPDACEHLPLPSPPLRRSHPQRASQMMYVLSSAGFSDPMVSTFFTQAAQRG